MSTGIPRSVPALGQLQWNMSNKQDVCSIERLTCQSDCRAFLEGGKGDEIVFTQDGTHQSEGFVLIRFRMHLASEVLGETVEREERWIGDESAETSRASAVDGGGVALRDSQRGVVNEAEGGYGALRQSPLAKHCDTGENQLDIHCQNDTTRFWKESSFDFLRMTFPPMREMARPRRREVFV